MTRWHDHELSAGKGTANVISLFQFKGAKLSYPSFELQFHGALDHHVKVYFGFSPLYIFLVVHTSFQNNLQLSQSKGLSGETLLPLSCDVLVHDLHPPLPKLIPFLKSLLNNFSLLITHQLDFFLLIFLPLVRFDRE